MELAKNTASWTPTQRFWDSGSVLGQGSCVLTAFSGSSAAGAFCTGSEKHHCMQTEWVWVLSSFGSQGHCVSLITLLSLLECTLDFPNYTLDKVSSFHTFVKLCITFCQWNLTWSPKVSDGRAEVELNDWVLPLAPCSGLSEFKIQKAWYRPGLHVFCEGQSVLCPTDRYIWKSWILWNFVT